MKSIIDILLLSWVWLTLASIMSLFWGVRAIVLFERERNFWWKSYQFIFNFIGSFFGWGCFYVLLVRTQNSMPTFKDFSVGDVVLFVLSLLGLTGHLPQATYGLVAGLADIARKITTKVTKV